MTIEERLDALEARCRKAEDHLEILNLLNTYGPLVDSCTAKEAAELWIEGGKYSFTKPDGEPASMSAPDEIASVYAWPGHVELTETGCAHMTATPRIKVDGDAARALAYSFVVLREGERWFVWRAAVNHWTLTRTGDGWRIVERFNRPLDGSKESHETMQKVLEL
jgi:hypothetical protein